MWRRFLLVVEEITEYLFGSFESETAHGESTVFVGTALLVGESHVEVLEPSEPTEVHVEIICVLGSPVRLLESLIVNLSI